MNRARARASAATVPGASGKGDLPPRLPVIYTKYLN